MNKYQNTCKHGIVIEIEAEQAPNWFNLVTVGEKTGIFPLQGNCGCTIDYSDFKFVSKTRE